MNTYNMNLMKLLRKKNKKSVPECHLAPGPLSVFTIWILDSL